MCGLSYMFSKSPYAGPKDSEIRTPIAPDYSPSQYISGEV